MATTVAQLLAQIDDLVQEDSSFSTGLWNTTELIDYVNDAQEDMILQSQILKQITNTLSVNGQRIYSDPAFSMQIDRITFNLIPLYRSTRHALDLENRKWRTLSGTPRRYHQDHLPNKQYELDRAFTAALAGLNIGVVSTVLPAQVTALVDNLTIPDYAVYVLKFGVLALMLAKQGEAQDIAKAKYCEERFDYGCGLLLRLIVGGQEENNG